MNRLKASCVSSLVAVAALIAGCSDQGMPTASPDTSSPDGSPQYVSTTTFATSSNLTSRKNAVKWSKGHTNGEYEASGYIGSAGGTLSIAGADFTITFPQGALSETREIKITAAKGMFVVYNMEPHGITFKVPVTVTQGLKNTAAYNDQLLAGTLVGVYVEGDTPAADGSIDASEVLTSQTFFLIGGDGLLTPQYQTWEINHFSRYMLASG